MLERRREAHGHQFEKQTQVNTGKLEPGDIRASLHQGGLRLSPSPSGSLQLAAKAAPIDKGTVMEKINTGTKRIHLLRCLKPITQTGAQGCY